MSDNDALGLFVTIVVVYIFLSLYLTSIHNKLDSISARLDTLLKRLDERDGERKDGLKPK